MEGGSGSGKTTAIKGIQPALDGWKFFREPGGTDFGELMRVAVQETHGIEIDPMAAFMAYSASRANLIRCEILPVLDGLREGKGALLDRYWYSTYAYQGGEGIEKEIIVQVSNMVTNDLVPELVLHYDLAPELAILRKDGCLKDWPLWSRCMQTNPKSKCRWLQMNCSISQRTTSPGKYKLLKEDEDA